jgi:16S rRNA (uracil1498-N3)-methyltransferase
MTRRRFYVPAQNISADTAVLPPEQAHHLRDVLRLSVGDQVELFDGRGNGYTGIITDNSREVRVGRLKRQVSSQIPRPRLTLATALIKPDRFEWMLEKATELGADEFIPLTTRFTNVRIPGQRLEGRLQRWKRIVTEAARQSGRQDVPDVLPPVEFARILEDGRLSPLARFILFEGVPRLSIPDCTGPGGALLCIGPEGGWDQSELDAAASAGFQVFNLGQSILRSETAAIAAVALFRFHVARMAVGDNPFPSASRGCEVKP